MRQFIIANKKDINLSQWHHNYLYTSLHGVFWILADTQRLGFVCYHSTCGDSGSSQNRHWHCYTILTSQCYQCSWCPASNCHWCEWYYCHNACLCIAECVIVQSTTNLQAWMQCIMLDNINMKEIFFFILCMVRGVDIILYACMHGQIHPG